MSDTVRWDALSFTCEMPSSEAATLAVRNPSRGSRQHWFGVIIAGVCVLFVFAKHDLLALGELEWLDWVPNAALLFGCVCGMAIVAASRQVVVEEAVIVVGEVGAQFITTTRGGSVTKRLLDASRIRAVIVNDHVSLFGVHNYVGMVVDELDHMEVLFPTFKTPIPVVEQTYWTVAHVLQGEPKPIKLSQALFDRRRMETTIGGLKEERSLARAAGFTVPDT